MKEILQEAWCHCWHITIEYMRGVDRHDQVLSYYNPLRKSFKWYKMVVLHTIDMAAGNAHTVYKKLWWLTDPDLVFVDSWIRNLLSPDAEISARAKVSTGSMQGLWLVTLGGQQRALYWMHTTVWGVHQKGEPLKTCVVCTAKGVRKETRYCCETWSSKPALCIIPCFELFHTVRNLSED